MKRQKRACLTCPTDMPSLFQQETYADADLAITTASSNSNNDAVTSKFPVHQAVICASSECFTAQAANCQQQQQQQAGVRPQLSMTVEPGHMEAAVAFIKAMYDHESLRNASQEQLVHILLLAEQFGAPVIVSNTVQLLKAAGSSSSGLGPAAVTTLAQLPSWPDSFMPITHLVLRSMLKLLSLDPAAMAATYTQWVSNLADLLPQQHSIFLPLTQCSKPPLLAAFGDLDAVWRDEHLKTGLLHLPLSAMEVLLGSRELTAASEDTVCYTVIQYSSQPQHAGSTKPLQQLLQLVRYPQLSRVCLTAAEVGAAQAKQVFRLMHLQQQLKGDTPGLSPFQELAQALQKEGGYPAAWSKGRRPWSNSASMAMMPSCEAKVTGQLPFAVLREACSSKRFVRGPDSPPVYGMAWHTRTNGSVLEVGCDVSPMPLIKAAVFKLCVMSASGQMLFQRSFDSTSGVCVPSSCCVTGMFAVEGAEGGVGARVKVLGTCQLLGMAAL